MAEDARKNLPSNNEARQRQAEWLIANEKGKALANAKGLNWDRVKLLSVSAVEAANKKKKQHRNQNEFADYESKTANQYSRLVKKIPTYDAEKYQVKRREVGDDIFYGGAHAISQNAFKDSPKAIDNLVNDLEQQFVKRKTFSRRRTFNDEADIDYINERNMRFNKKLERFYGDHTAEIKQNLERGTAI